MTFELYKYQKKGVRTIQHFNGRALLADEMGLGKTLQALTWTVEQDAFPAVVFCPASLKFVWQEEAEKFYGIPNEILNGQTTHRTARKDLTILNYEISPYWVDLLIRRNKPKTVIFDEGHYLTNKERQRTQTAKQISETCKHVIGISGTPLTNNPKDLFSLINIINPGLFPSFTRYIHAYTRPRMTRYGWNYNDAKNLDRLHAILKKSMMIRRLKKDVLTELPPKLETVVPLPISNRDEYDKISGNFLGWLRENDFGRFLRASHAPEICRMNELRQLAATGKLSAVFNWVDSFLQESTGKIILFGIHQNIIDALEKRYKKQCVRLSGETKQAQRKTAVNRFQTDKKIRVFVGNIDAAGTGITLTAASAVAFVELPWRPAELIQAADRAHRIGQTEQVSVYYLVGKETIEQDICEMLRRKHKHAKQTLDGLNDSDLFKRVLTTMKGKS